MEEDISCLRTLKSGEITEYIEKINAQIGIGVPTTCAYQYCGDTSNIKISAIIEIDFILAVWGAGGGKEESKVTYI
eukprot:3677284-Ditylum_brightwellii.AAC.1